MPAKSAKVPTGQTCAKCDGTMEMGYLHGPWMYQPLQVQTWNKGRPTTPANFGTKGKQPVVVTTWRCAGCGFLESYAR
jgi:hypothetical protein